MKRKHVFDSLQVCTDSGLPEDEVWAQAKEILQEMSHNLKLGAIRAFAMFLVKVLKALFRRIYVNEEGIQKVKIDIKWQTTYHIIIIVSLYLSRFIADGET